MKIKFILFVLIFFFFAEIVSASTLAGRSRNEFGMTHCSLRHAELVSASLNQSKKIPESIRDDKNDEYWDSITVLDSVSLLPVSDVNIYSKDRTRGTSSDKNGGFNLNIFFDTDSLILSHVSYKTKIINKNSIKNSKIFLVPNSIEQKVVEVIDKKMPGPDQSFKEEIKINKENLAGFISAGDLLNKKSSLSIKDYGGFGGVKNISARGLSSENTTVLFNEARVNDLRTGIFDLSSISTASIDKIIYQKNPDEIYSSAGGLLRIFAGQRAAGQNLKLGLRLSSDLYQSGFISYKNSYKNFYYSLNAERGFSSNNYNFKFNDEDLKRKNAHFNKSFLSAGIGYSTDNIDINFYSHYSYFNSGIPGFVVTNNYSSSRAWNKSETFLGILNSDYSISENFMLKNNISVNRQNLTIADPDGIVIFSSESKNSKLTDASINSSLVFKKNYFSASAGYEFNYSKLNNITSFISANISPDLIQRKNNKFYTSFSQKFISPVSFLTRISFNGGGALELVNEDIFSEKKSRIFSYNFGLNVIPSDLNFLVIKVHYGKENRFPTFNERYYSSLFGHYDLTKERYNIFDGGFEAKLKSTSFSLVYFLVKGRDKIIWIPTRLAIQTPRNIAKISSEGIEAKIETSFFDEAINLTGFYTFNRALNKSQVSSNDLSYNKLLVYSPEHRINFNAQFKIDDVSLSIYNSFTSKRFYTSDNANSYILPEYFVTDASLTYRFNLFNLDHSITSIIYNLFNEEYFVIQSYPMPLRTFLFTYLMEIK